MASCYISGLNAQSRATRLVYEAFSSQCPSSSTVTKTSDLNVKNVNEKSLHTIDVWRDFFVFIDLLP